MNRMILVAAVFLAGCAPPATPTETTPKPTSSPSPSTRNIDGIVGLTAAASAQTADGCAALPDYSDIREGTQVLVKDRAGMVIGTSALKAPEWLAALSVCTFSFVVLSVPDSTVYVVEPATRVGLGLTFSRADIEAHNWHVEMQFGP